MQRQDRGIKGSRDIALSFPWTGWCGCECRWADGQGKLSSGREEGSPLEKEAMDTVRMHAPAKHHSVFRSTRKKPNEGSTAKEGVSVCRVQGWCTESGQSIDPKNSFFCLPARTLFALYSFSPFSLL